MARDNLSKTGTPKYLQTRKIRDAISFASSETSYQNIPKPAHALTLFLKASLENNFLNSGPRRKILRLYKKRPAQTSRAFKYL